jgi:hypothetical protein
MTPMRDVVNLPRHDIAISSRHARPYRLAPQNALKKRPEHPLLPHCVPVNPCGPSKTCGPTPARNPARPPPPAPRPRPPTPPAYSTPPADKMNTREAWSRSVY